MSSIWMLPFLASLFVPIAPRPEASELKELVDLANRYSVPMPPKNGAVLVLAHNRVWGGKVGGKYRDSGNYSPAFLLEKRVDGSIVVLTGMQEKVLQPKWFLKGEPLWREFSSRRMEGDPGGYVTWFTSPETFVCAVQLASCGDFDTAHVLLKLFMEDYHGDELNAQKDPNLLFANIIADNLEYRLTKGQATWKDVRHQLRKLFNEFPKLNIGFRRELLNDLTTTLDSSPPIPGSVEALLLDWAGRPGKGAYSGLFFDSPLGKSAIPAREILLRGFDAVPDLLSRLEDPRVTTHTKIGQVSRVRDLAKELLWEIAGEPIRSRADRDSVAWQMWWKQACVRGERHYFADTVFQLGDGKQIVGINRTIAQIIANKFPDQLPQLWEVFLNRAASEASPYEFVEAVVTSRLPVEDRVKMLTQFAGLGSLVQRTTALTGLAKLDAKTCVNLLMPLMKKMPCEVEGLYRLSPESYFGAAAIELDNDLIWREYLRIAKQSKVGLRLEILSVMGIEAAENKNRRRQLAFLAVFLNDKDIRSLGVEQRKYDKLSAASEFPKIAVQDFAAMKIAEVLALEDTPDKSWDVTQWAKLRNEVRRKLAYERLPTFELDR